MATVRDATFELLRAHDMTTMFGNPGSTELTMLANFPDDFTYILGLQELVVMGMADGYAQATGRPTLVNLHTAPGLGNAVGGIFNAQVNRAPLVITAGQQVRPQIMMEASLTNRDATLVPVPFVKWSHEPTRPQDVPGAIARAIHHASLPPRGPAFVSIPMDDWGQEADSERDRHALSRAISGRQAPDPLALAQLADALRAAINPVLIAGPEIDAAGGWDAAVALVDKQRLPVWAAPVPGGGRIGFPESHAAFRGILPLAIRPVSETLKEHDLVLVAGSSVFPYYPYVPGPLLAEGSSLMMLTSDPAEAARAPMGDAILGDVALALEQLTELVGDSRRDAPEARPEATEPLRATPMSASQAFATLKAVWPEDAIAVVESPSSTPAVRNRLRLSKPGSWYLGSSGGLGFGIAAALGVQLAQPERPVICILGDGSAQYGITALWTAVTYRLPVTFLVLRNQEYMILKWFAALEQVAGAPGLDLPGLDVAAVARGYDVPSTDVEEPDELREALRIAIADDTGPRLVQVKIASGMSTE